MTHQPCYGKFTRTQLQRPNVLGLKILNVLIIRTLTLACCSVRWKPQTWFGVRLVPGLETGFDDTVDGHKLKVDFHSVGLITMRHRDNGLLDGVDEVSESNTKVSLFKVYLLTCD